MNTRMTDSLFIFDKIKVKAKIVSTNNDYECETNEVINSITQPYYYISNNPEENYGDLSEDEEFEFHMIKVFVYLFYFNRSTKFIYWTKLLGCFVGLRLVYFVF